MFWSVPNRRTLQKGHGQIKGSLKFTSCSCSSCQRHPGRTRVPAPQQLCHLLGVPFPEAAAKVTLRTSAGGDPAGPVVRVQSILQLLGNTRHWASHWELMGLYTLFMGGTWAQPLRCCPYVDLRSVMFVTLSSPRLSQLWRYQLYVSSAKCGEQANVF